MTILILTCKRRNKMTKKKVVNKKIDAKNIPKMTKKEIARMTKEHDESEQRYFEGKLKKLTKEKQDEANKEYNEHFQGLADDDIKNKEKQERDSKWKAKINVWDTFDLAEAYIDASTNIIIEALKDFGISPFGAKLVLKNVENKIKEGALKFPTEESEDVWDLDI